MNRLIKFCWGVSVLIFLILLLWVYSYMPEQVGLSKDATGTITNEISREVFFYAGLAIFVVSNLILYILSKLFRIIPKGKSSLLANSTVAARLEGWSISFSWALNICYMFLIIYLGFFNNPGSFKYMDYSGYFIIYLAPIIILLWLVALVVLLLRKA